MATTTIPWGDGSGDNIYLTYPSASGDQTVDVSSDANTGAARSKVVAFTSDVGNIIQNLTVSQVSGETPGGGLSDYVQDGLVFHLDGKKKLDSDGKWHSLVGNFVFTNNGAIFNDDHVWFDGEDDYLVRTTTSNIQSSSSGTLEVVYDSTKQSFGTIIRTSANGQVAYASYSSGTKVVWTTGNPMRAVYTNPPIKGTVSLCIAQGIANGSVMGTSGTNYYNRISGGVFIGRNGASGTSPFSGKIYSIRMYNRNLTVEEVLQNQSVDNIRFNLGLTLE